MVVSGGVFDSFFDRACRKCKRSGRSADPACVEGVGNACGRAEGGGRALQISEAQSARLRQQEIFKKSHETCNKF